MFRNDSAVAGGGGGRPTLLTVFLILSFISAGLGILGGLFMVLGMGAFMDQLGGFAQAGMAMAIPGLILAAARGVGAFMMWQYKKMGFYVYSGASVIELLIPMIIGPMMMGMEMTIPWIAIAVTGAWIGVYYKHINLMK